jgi:hypothetical protein
MTTPKDVKWVEESCEPGDSQTDALADTGRQPAGRIIHDARGNAVWQWAGDGDPSSTGTSSGILKYIDPRDLNVEAQGGGLSASRGSRTRVTDSGGGYDPYNQDEIKNKTTVAGKKAKR